jgi:hypothetical protein
MSSGPIERLRAAVRASGTPLISSLGYGPDAAASSSNVDEDRDRSGGEPERALVAAAGPRTAAHRDDVEIAVAAVDEGYRLHYGDPRALHIDDIDLRLLAGDRLYALGLARLAAIGDLTAIAELADVISLSAQAHAAGDGDLADAAWQAGVSAIAWGTSSRARDAKARARAGDPDAADALREAARSRSDAPVA